MAPLQSATFRTIAGRQYTLVRPTVADARTAEASGSAPTRSSDMAENVLVVEDDEVVRMLLRLLLQDEGLTVTEAASGPEAVEL